MSVDKRLDLSNDTSSYKNAVIGENAMIDPDVVVGYPYHPEGSPARIGKSAILRKGTIIYADVNIGDHFQSAHYAVVRAMVQIGNYCTLLNHSTLEGIVRMGTGVRIMSHVYVPSRTWFGDNVFVGPGVNFLNDRYPLRKDPMPEPRGATLEDDVMIGGGCTILPGVTIGERSFIAAGAVVNKNIPPHSFVVGVPGHISPLPNHLDMSNNKEVTHATRDFWHPKNQYPVKSLWPDYWAERFIVS